MRGLALALTLAALPVHADPVLSLAGTLPSNGDYGLVLQAIEGIGAEATSLTLYWDEFDRGGSYAPEDDWPAIANAIYPPRGLALHLTLAVIDTAADRRPADLAALSWDAPEVSARFEAHLTEVLDRLPDIDLLALIIGNEVDANLTDESRPAFAAFFDTARAAAQRLRPDLPVMVTQTWGALRSDPDARDLANRGDGWSVTYYPLDAGFAAAPPESAATDLAAMRLLASGPIWLAEAGYPSDGCGAASPTAQARFFEVLLDAATDLPLVQLVWSHDISEAEVAAYRDYYGVADPCFDRFLGTLGLRTRDDRAKPAFDALANR